MLFDIMSFQTKPIGTNNAWTENLQIVNNFGMGEGKIKKHLNHLFNSGLRIPLSYYL